MEKKQSSIEWYANASHELIVKKSNGEITEREFLTMHHNLFYDAEAMHKEEIETAWINGTRGQMIAPFGMNRYKPEAQEYYNEEFVGNNE